MQIEMFFPVDSYAVMPVQETLFQLNLFSLEGGGCWWWIMWDMVSVWGLIVLRANECAYESNAENSPKVVHNFEKIINLKLNAALSVATNVTNTSLGAE